MRAPLDAGGLRISLRKPVDLRTEDQGDWANGDLSIRLRWEPDGGPFPSFDGVLRMESSEGGGVDFVLDGSYEPPGGIPGKAFDVLLGRRIAATTARDFLERLRRYIEHAGMLEGQLTGVRIFLLTDDSAAERELLKYCGEWQASFSESSDSAEALTILCAAASAGSPFDVAIIDAASSNATAVTREIFEDPALYDTAMVLLAEPTPEAAPRRAWALGYSSVITKPLNPGTVFDALVLALRDAVPPFADGVTAMRVLLVSDDEVDREGIVEHLQRLGYAVEVAPDCESALSWSRGGAYGAIIVDAQLSQFLALRTVKMLNDRARENGSIRHAPIIVVTSTPTPGENVAFDRAGIDDYLIKPVRADTLRRCMRRFSKAM
jgi:CheY-like chemotaxis protein